LLTGEYVKHAVEVMRATDGTDRVASVWIDPGRKSEDCLGRIFPVQSSCGNSRNRQDSGLTASRGNASSPPFRDVDGLIGPRSDAVPPALSRCQGKNATPFLTAFSPKKRCPFQLVPVTASNRKR